MNTRMMLCALAAAAATTTLSPLASAQPLGGSNLFVYVLEDFTHCYQVDPLRNYRVRVSIENCIQNDPDHPDPLEPNGWVFVSQDDSISPVAEITSVYGLNGNPGDLEPTLAGLNPADPEYSHLADEKITTQDGFEYFSSETAMVQIFQLPDMLPDHDLSMVDFSDPFSVVRVFRTYCPLSEVYFPCPADMNNDGVQDLTDISAFIGSFLGQQPAADIDGNGVYDLTDLVAFIDFFTAGCP